jgi:hypothetical protein
MKERLNQFWVFSTHHATIKTKYRLYMEYLCHQIKFDQNYNYELLKHIIFFVTSLALINRRILVRDEIRKI